MNTESDYKLSVDYPDEFILIDNDICDEKVFIFIIKLILFFQYSYFILYIFSILKSNQIFLKQMLVFYCVIFAIKLMEC